MKIDCLEIQNFKGFESKKLKFNPQVTVLIGSNGAGKSSVLDAISIALGTYLMNTGASFGLNGRKTRPLQKKEIRKTIVSEENIEYNDVLLKGEFLYENKALQWSREQPATSKSLSHKHAKELTSLGKSHSKNVKSDMELPLIAYHSTARLAGEIVGRTTAYEKTGSRLDGFYACLDPRSIKQKFVSWFKTYEDNVLKFDKDKSLYNAFTNAITSIVKDWVDVKFHWGLDDIIGKTPNGTWVSFSNLSDGYRGLISLAADIAYRAIKLNPHLGENAVINTKGIVLIDEIDMHLHPKWQKSIISDLKSTFPNIQFVITSHSPFIIQSLRKEEIINLDGGIDENPFLKSIEEIAEQDMYVNNVRRSSTFIHFQEVSAKYFELIQLGKTSETDNETKKIKDELDLLEQEFNKDPIFLSLLQAERKSELK